MASNDLVKTHCRAGEGTAIVSGFVGLPVGKTVRRLGGLNEIHRFEKAIYIQGFGHILALKLVKEQPRGDFILQLLHQAKQEAARFRVGT
jgi:hypothetical protein